MVLCGQIDDNSWTWTCAYVATLGLETKTLEETVVVTDKRLERFCQPWQGVVVGRRPTGPGPVAASKIGCPANVRLIPQVYMILVTFIHSSIELYNLLIVQWRAELVVLQMSRLKAFFARKGGAPVIQQSLHCLLP